MVVYYYHSFLFLKVYTRFLSTCSDSLFSILLWCKIIDVACCTTMVLILLKVYLMIFWRILNFSSIIFIVGMCVVALAFFVITISGSTFYPLLVMLFISG